MKILYLTQYFNPPQAYGSTRHYEMAKRLASNGHEVHVLTSAAFRRNLEKSIFPENAFMLDGIHVHVLQIDYHQSMNHKQRLFAFFKFAIMAGFAKLPVRPDVVFASSTPLTIILPAWMQKIRHRVPLVFEVRDLWPDVPIAIGAIRSRWMQWAAHTLERFAYHQSKAIVALSPDMAAGILRKGISEDKVTIIPNACDFDRFEIDDGIGHQVKSNYPEFATRPWVLYAGTIGRINGLRYMVEVAKVLHDMNSDLLITVVGSGSEKEELLQLAKDTGVLEKTILFLPAQSKESIPAFHAAAEVCCSTVMPIPALEANSANKFFDALAASRPVFINYGGWQADCLEQNNAGIADRSCIPVVGAKMLHDLIQDKPRLQTIRTNAEKLGRDQFDRDLLAYRLEAVLHNAVTQSE